jgi:hypothetical protein
LMAAELTEPNVWFRQDYRQAAICLSLAERGEAAPFVSSSYRIYGTHPDLVWYKIQANRHARLGKEYGQWYTSDGMLLPDIGAPKKPSIFIDEQAEQATNQRLAALLMFPPQGVQHANVEQTGTARKPPATKGTLYEMPQAARSAEYRPLRILPA